MATATLTTKGQVTIPIAVRAALGLNAGSRIEFVQNEQGQYLIVPAVRSIKVLKGVLQKMRKPVSIEDMNRAIAAQGAKAK